MSQVVNGVTSSSKRPIGSWQTLFLRQNVSRKLLPEKATHKEVRVFVRDKLKTSFKSCVRMKELLRQQ